MKYHQNIVILVSTFRSWNHKRLVGNHCRSKNRCVFRPILRVFGELIFIFSSSFRESTDGRSIVGTFDMRDVPKQNIHVSFQKIRLVITWETAELYEWEENGYIMRERSERMFHRTLPLPEGTRVITSFLPTSPVLIYVHQFLV